MLDDRSGVFRSRVLAPSGGWLGEGVILISDLLGVWDIFVLMTLFVVFWVFVRVMSCEVSMLLGFMFDFSIPLQYYNDESQRSNHEKHLEKYWPMFTIGTIVEAVGFFQFHPDLFTLVVCIKTCVCLAFWLSRNADGSKVALGETARSNSSSPSSSEPSSSSTRPSSSSRASSNQPSSRHQSSNQATSNQAEKEHGSSDRKLTEAMKRLPKPVDPRFPDAEARLKEVGYSEECRDGMVYHMKGEHRKYQAEENFDRWLHQHVHDPKKMATREKKYRERNQKEREARAKKMLVKAAVEREGSGNAEATRSAPPELRRRREVTKLEKETLKQIKDRVYDSSIEGCPDGLWSNTLTREKYIDSLLAIEDPDELRDELAWWELYTQSGARLNLAKKFPHNEVEELRKMLINDLYMGGHCIYMADKMIEDMMDQPSVEAANAMRSHWVSIADLKDIDEEIHANLVGIEYRKYQDSVFEPYPYRSKPFPCARLKRRWDR